MSSEATLPPPDFCSLLSSICVPQTKKLATTTFGKTRVILLAGPTGCGKTALSLHLAKVLNVEVISADSVQVYRGMNIGTAKVPLAQRLLIPHHLIDIRNLNERFHVADFYMEATAAIQGIIATKKVPLVVGGTGLYFNALLYGMPDSPPSVMELRQALEKECLSCGVAALYQRLVEKDPEYAATISSGDRQKIIRALEIITLTGGKVGQQPWRNRPPLSDYDCRCWFIHRPRPVLYRNVEERCQQMLQEGLVNEVMDLEEYGLRDNPSAAQSIGYRQCLEYLQSAQTPQDYARFVEQFKQASRHYIKKQETWFRREALFRWLDIEQIGTESAAQIILDDYLQ